MGGTQTRKQATGKGTQRSSRARVAVKQPARERGEHQEKQTQEQRAKTKVGRKGVGPREAGARRRQRAGGSREMREQRSRGRRGRSAEKSNTHQRDRRRRQEEELSSPACFVSEKQQTVLERIRKNHRITASQRNRKEGTGRNEDGPQGLSLRSLQGFPDPARQELCGIICTLKTGHTPTSQGHGQDSTSWARPE